MSSSTSATPPAPDAEEQLQLAEDLPRAFLTEAWLPAGAAPSFTVFNKCDLMALDLLALTEAGKPCGISASNRCGH